MEDEKRQRSMGVIRKKTASRGTEAGTKYHCDICSVDVTSTVGGSVIQQICDKGQVTKLEVIL